MSCAGAVTGARVELHLYERDLRDGYNRATGKPKEFTPLPMCGLLKPRDIVWSEETVGSWDRACKECVKLARESGEKRNPYLVRGGLLVMQAVPLSNDELAPKRARPLRSLRP